MSLKRGVMRKIKREFKNISKAFKDAREMCFKQFGGVGLKTQATHKKSITKNNPFTQKAVAKRFGDSGQCVSNLERGLQGLPPEKFFNLSVFFGVDPDLFVRAHLLDEAEYLYKVLKSSQESSTKQKENNPLH